MTFSHAISTNNYGPAKFIVDASPANGTHTTIASALTSASSGDTIFIRPGIYTENLTLKAGVNLTAYSCDAFTPNVTIVGTCTFSAAGTVSISGIRLETNSAPCLTVTGASSIVNLINCYINASDNTAISQSNGIISAYYCTGDLAAIGIGLFALTGGDFVTEFCQFTNSGGSTTASTCADGRINFQHSNFLFPITVSGTTGTINAFSSGFSPASTVVALTQNSTTATAMAMRSCTFIAGTAAGVEVGAGAAIFLEDCIIKSTAANAVTGAGSVSYGALHLEDTAVTVSTTTQVADTFRYGIARSTLQPAFLARHGVAQNDATGAGGTVTVNFTTVVFDQNGDYDGTNTFVAPVAGRYQFNASVYINDAATSTFAIFQFLTTGGTFLCHATTPFSTSSLDQYQLTGSILINMAATDTVVVQVAVNGMAGATADLPAGVGQTFFSGYLVC